ncbi:MAG TPA: TetR/AcrR family transcriptional regulator [Coriobacteriia bacterium]
MPPPVKGRSYDNSARTQASRARQAQVLTAARTLFLERGYVRTTMQAIADEAGVALDTVYELVGRKPDMFRLLIETAISGGDQAVAADDRDYVQRIRAEGTAQGKLRVYAEALPAIMSRLAPLVMVVQAAASAEPALGDLWHEIAERRATNMGRFAAELGDTGQLAIPVEEAADIIWATNSPELYALLVHQRGWTAERYGRWLAESWERMLLGPREVTPH